MTLKTFAAACAAVCALSATAAMAGEPITVKLAQPVATQAKVIVNGAMFVCDGDACVAQAPMSNTFGNDTCRAVAAKFGPVTAFEGHRSFDAARLADCNTVAARTAATQTAAK